ncbi:MAG: sialate O-acetylesterase [Planctomycetota bacterium]|nr:sialate O-acetylesterase [Planctomycetota bacterium]
MRSSPLFSAVLFLVTCLSCSALAAQSKLRLPAVLGDHMVLQQGKPINIWGWAAVGEQVKVTFAGASASAVAGAKGRWSLQLPAQKASRKPRKLTVEAASKIELRDVLVGEVWLCSGQSNMAWSMSRTTHQKEEIKKAVYPRIRLLAFGGKKILWTACTAASVKGFSGVGYHFGKRLHQALKVPIGLIRSAVGGTRIEPWTPKVGAARFDSLAQQAAKGDGNLFRRLIAPLAPMSMRGIIWYQGESNVIQGDTGIYADRQAALVAGWRDVFEQDDLSFYYVQLAPFTYGKNYAKSKQGLTPESLPRFWEAQTKCMKTIPNSGMVVITDITGNVRDIHPGNKRDVGGRLARWALAKNYGRNKVTYSGPLYKSMQIAGSKVTLTFDHVAGGLRSLDKAALTEFSIAGEDRQFVSAKAKIKGDTVIVWSGEVANPKAVRFGWRDTALPNLGNKAGLPASPFRTDIWK